jgi:Ser/Thr protein kinase RdoA (MazF antagonist)
MESSMSETEVDQFRTAILSAFPALADASFRLATLGWDSVAVDVDGRLIFKFPRNEGAEKRLRMEIALLDVIRPRVSLPVPDMALHEGPPLFSRHEKLKGEHLLTAQYELLAEQSRTRLADDLACFYGELHAIEQAPLVAAGAAPLVWSPVEIIRAKVGPVLPPELRSFAEETLSAYERLPPDPHGTRYCFCDGHGWNMAFDHARERLNGIYDFGDSGLAPLHQEFIYSNFISRDLTERIVTAYESFTGRNLDRRRIDILTGTHRLWEMGETAGDPANRQLAIDNVAAWAAYL